MPFIILFIYFNYMLKTGYDVSVFEWGCLFMVGVIQIAAWLVKTGILTEAMKPPSDGKKMKRLDDWVGG